VKQPTVNKPFVWPLDAHGFSMAAYAKGRDRVRTGGMIPDTAPDMAANEWRWFLAGCYDQLNSEASRRAV